MRFGESGCEAGCVALGSYDCSRARPHLRPEFDIALRCQNRPTQHTQPRGLSVGLKTCATHRTYAPRSVTAIQRHKPACVRAQRVGDLCGAGFGKRNCVCFVHFWRQVSPPTPEQHHEPARCALTQAKPRTGNLGRLISAASKQYTAPHPAPAR